MTCELLTSIEGCCEWCGKALRGRQKRWCSRRCNREFTANHRWTQAKDWIRRLKALFRCEDCGEVFAWDEIDVDHIKPALGKHGTWGCHHHQTNLRILCKPCHKVRTRQQHADGELRAHLKERK